MTGANYLLESGDTKILVDCGMQQGSRYAEKQNLIPFPYNPSEIHGVFITHAHIDHTGRLPKLVRDGYKGMVYSTPPTRDFAELLLIDSEHVLREEAKLNGETESLYTLEDVDALMGQWKGIPYHKPFVIGPFTVEFFDAGHILGSSVIKISAEGKTIAFSGDLGNFPAPIIHNTESLPDVDYCVLESTYGNRVHEGVDTRVQDLEDAIEDTVMSGGVLMIPAFAMERTQELLYHLHHLFEGGRVPRVPVFIDSPLAIKLTVIYKKYESYFNKETFDLVRSGDDILNFPGLRLTLTVEQSKEINSVPAPKVILAGSGMSNGGRILHHEQRYLSDPKSCILFVGYQAENTLGRRILEGAKTVYIYGQPVTVNCKIRSLTGYSAHADQPHLLAWLLPRRTTLKKVFVVQGEADASSALAQKIRDELAVATVVPEAHGEVVL